MSPVTCVVADAQLLNREGLVALLRTQSNLQVVGSAGSVAEAATLCRRERPDLLILDNHLPGIDGASAIQSILKFAPGTCVLALVEEVGQRCDAALAAGADGVGIERFPCCGPQDCIGRAVADGALAVLPRSARGTHFFHATKMVAANRPWFPSATVHGMADCLMHRHQSNVSALLSQRELEVAELVSDGLCNKEISDRLNIEVGTVKKHVGHILNKLQLRDRLQVGLFFSRRPPSRDDPG